MPAATPAEVRMSPSSTNSTSGSSFTRGYRARKASACAQWVVAGRSSSSPAAARRNAPVQMDITLVPRWCASRRAARTSGVPCNVTELPCTPGAWPFFQPHNNPVAIAIGKPHRLHRAWIVAAVAFVATVGAAGFRATPGVMINPLHQEFGWSTGIISLAVSVNLILFGLTAPFAAALMERFGMRRVVSSALLLVAAGSGLTVFMRASWQLVLCWGILVGLGTGSVAMSFAALVTGRWFVKRRGIVTGVLTAGGAAGQPGFPPVLGALPAPYRWRDAPGPLPARGAAPRP